ncbi:MAG: pyridoxal phosphate-dependent aminotransferase [Candidatus Cloacimonetes bacterium]|nr:pyridoxal phosphate-dependent aminotransferase [Candidatus Cloacimonadota bacterium]
MAIQLSHRARAIKPSPTLTVSSLAKKMKAQGIDVINFGVGEPDFNTPEYIKEEAKKAIDDNFTRYTASAGIIELRRVISEKLLRDNDLHCDPEDILVSPGAKASIINVLMAVCDPRDEVIIPSPYWVSYTSQVEMVDSFPVIVPTKASAKFKLKAKVLDQTLKTLSNPKALILNSPNNPTGSVYSRKELTEIAEVCIKHNILIISDEIYEKLIYDNEKHVSIASISKEVREHTVVINGVSKAYAMTGWRLGYCAGPSEIIKQASRIQSHTTSCVNAMTQKAAIVALRECDGSVTRMREEFELRRNYFIERVRQIDNVTCIKPHGAFYVMPNISFYLQKNKRGIKTSVDLCEYLLQQHHIAVVPGSAFGADNYVRFSYANSMENIKEGLVRFERGLLELLT